MSDKVVRLIDANALMQRICGKECGQHFKECDIEGDDTRCVFRDYVQSEPTTEAKPIHENPEKGNPESEAYCFDCIHNEVCQYCPHDGCDFKEKAELDNGWISVDDRLPPYGERVFVYIPRPDNHNHIEIAYIFKESDDYPYWVLRDKSQFYSTRFHYISLWMPLPEPPISNEDKDGDSE